MTRRPTFPAPTPLPRAPLPPASLPPASLPREPRRAAPATTARGLRLLVLGMNYAPEPVGVAIYTTGLAEGLAACGHEVTVVAATPWYPAWAPMPGHGRGWSEQRERGVRVIRCPHPIPARPTAARRILQQGGWAAAAAGPMLARAARGIDAVLAIAPAALAAPVALATARIAGVPAWLHVQDFEAEAVFGAGLIDSRGRLGQLAARTALGFEAGLMRRFDRVSAISPAMRAKLAEKGVAPDRIRELRNWAEDSIRPIHGPSPYRREWGLEGRRVALYSGNLGAKQGLGLVLEAARRLAARPELEDLVFVICGEGPQMARLQAEGGDLPNLALRPLQPMARLGELLGLADLHLLPQVAGAADLVLPSKLANMLASGRPVVATAAEGTQLAAEVAGCGLVSPPGDAEAFAESIAALAAAPRMRAALGEAAHARALARWDRASAIASAELELRAMAGRAEIPPSIRASASFGDEALPTPRLARRG